MKDEKKLHTDEWLNYAKEEAEKCLAIANKIYKALKIKG